MAQPWLLRGKSPESQAASRTFSLHPSPGPRRRVRWPLTWSRRRRSSADAQTAAKRSVSSARRPRLCARASRDPGSRTCYHSRPARLRGGGNTPPPLRLPAPHGQAPPSRAPGPGAPPRPEGTCAQRAALSRGSLGSGAARGLKARPALGARGTAGWKPTWLGAHWMAAPNGSCPRPLFPPETSSLCLSPSRSAAAGCPHLL